jgi:hypothetical protein
LSSATVEGLRSRGALLRPTPHRCSSSSPVEGSKQDPIDNPDWPIIVLSDHDPPVSDAVGCADPKDLALEPNRLLPGHHFGPVGSDPAPAADELPEWGRLKGCTGCEQSGGGVRIAPLPRISERRQPDGHIAATISSIVGSRRSSYARSRETLRSWKSLSPVPTGSLIARDSSEIARLTDWRIRHCAYVEKLVAARVVELLDRAHPSVPAEIGEAEVAVVAPGHPWEAIAEADSLVLVHLAWPPQPGSVTT